MKRLFSLVLMLAVLLTGCSISPNSVQVGSDPELISADTLLERILASVPEGAEAPETVSAEEQAAYLLLYGVDPEQVKDCAIARLGGSRVFELAVIDLTARSTSAEEGLLSYLLQRQGAFTGYAPDQAAIAKQSKLFAVEGDFRLILALTEDVDAVIRVLSETGYTRITEVETARSWDDGPSVSVEPEATTTTVPEPDPEITSEPSVEPSSEPSSDPSSAPSSEPSAEPSAEPSPDPSGEPAFELPQGWTAFTPPNIDDMSVYDTSAILAAWDAGSSDGLGRKDRWTYERCVEIISIVIQEDMTDYEKEWAIYSWLVSNVEYDWRHQNSLQITPRDSFRPYGALVNGTAVCLGYATAFQLLMDMLDIECITVVGAAFDSRDDHAWNMVKLNGQWYCVDATWDLGYGGSPSFCRYFNVTSDHMARTDHQWDYENTPMATATDGGKNG